MSDDITTRRMAERYAAEPEFKREVDMALGVFHVPAHPPGECALCDANHPDYKKPALPVEGGDECARR